MNGVIGIKDIYFPAVRFSKCLPTETLNKMTMTELPHPFGKA
ncbi:hypothetical protein L901_26410 [Agrobacterium sp. D14]|nr:hypothetical protein L901_26410 [Agrobacterium sp. D14]